jgi:hypothetical protein
MVMEVEMTAMATIILGLDLGSSAMLGSCFLCH